MLARGVSSFYPPRLLAPSCFPSKSFVSPACRISFRNSFVSPTYAKTAGYTPLRMSARRHFLSLFSQSPLPALLLFNHLRTLSFSISNLSAVLPTSSALLPQKPGVHPLVLQLSPPFRGTPFSRIATLFACLPFTGRWPLSVTPFPASLTKKEGGTGYWPALSTVEGSYQSSSLSAVDCRLLASPPYSPPCPTSPFPLQWEYPFPVLTGENQ
jgi:hypothetical protein